MKRDSIMMVLPAFFIAACSGSDHPVPQTDPSLHQLLERALLQAVKDSAALAAGDFRAEATMRVELRQEDESVNVTDRFVLLRDSIGYVAEQQSHDVEGDTSLLDNMYSFEDARGNPRAGERAQLASLDFGTSFPQLLRSLLAGGEGYGAELLAGDTLVGGIRSLLIRYVAPEREGHFILNTGSLVLVRLEVRQQSSYVVGSYDYRAVIDYRYFNGLRLPVETTTTFDYRRVFTDGSGTIRVVLDHVYPTEETTGTE